jgi:hypothetical protein
VADFLPRGRSDHPRFLRYASDRRNGSVGGARRERAGHTYVGHPNVNEAKMPAQVILEFEGVTTKEYDAVNAALGIVTSSVNRSSIAYGEEGPQTRNPFQFVLSTVAEFDSGTHDELFDHSRYEDLTRCGECRNASRDMDG